MNVILCGDCGKGLRPGQVGTWREFKALEQVGTKSKRTIDKVYTGRTLCAECALPPPNIALFDGERGPLGSKPMVGAAG